MYCVVYFMECEQLMERKEMKAFASCVVRFVHTLLTLPSPLFGIYFGYSRVPLDFCLCFFFLFFGVLYLCLLTCTGKSYSQPSPINQPHQLKLKLKLTLPISLEIPRIAQRRFRIIVFENVLPLPNTLQ